MSSKKRSMLSLTPLKVILMISKKKWQIAGLKTLSRRLLSAGCLKITEINWLMNFYLNRTTRSKTKVSWD
jgi:hypothetical protein